MRIESLYIRPETPQDQAFLARLYRSTRDDLRMLPITVLDGLLTMQFQAQQNSHRQQYPGADYCIVELDGEPVGCLAVHREPDAIRLVNIALLPETRNRGHGRGLIRSLQTEASTAGIPLTLSVSTQNAGAQRLYAALGFRITDDNGAYREMIWLPQQPA